MKPFRWSAEENDRLVAERGVSFERVVVAIENDGLLDVLVHPNPEKYPAQRVMVVAFDEYVFLVPYVEDEDHFFLKTIIPSRKATRDYLRATTRRTRRCTAMPKSDSEERALIDAFEAGELRSIATMEELERLRTAARATAVKDRRVNIRLSSGDLNDIQAKALEEGMPYQTLIASVLHKYVSGRLVDSREAS